MQTNILAFAFRGNISEQVLGNLSGVNKKIIASDQKQIEIFVSEFLASNPRFVIGLGEYSGKDKGKLRIETICSNKFRNQVQAKN